MTGSVLIQSEYEVADPSYIEYRTNRSLSYANSKESSFLCRSKGVISPENEGTCPLYSLKPVLQFALGVQVNHWNHSSYCPAIITHQRVLLFNNNNNKKNMTQKLKNLQSFTSKAALRSGHMHRFSWVRFNPPFQPIPSSQHTKLMHLDKDKMFVATSVWQDIRKVYSVTDFCMCTFLFLLRLKEKCAN